jgi:pyrroline-5-carboxylate reductase
MLSDQKIAVIGAGNIGQALIGGLLRSYQSVDPHQIRATRRNPRAIEQLEKDFPGIEAGSDNAAAVTDATVIILSIKPQNAVEIIPEIRDRVREDALVISVLAGLTTDVICKRLKKEVAVVRAMPNTPMLVDEGATAIAGGQYSTGRQVEIAGEIFEAVGLVEVVPEYLMDAVTGLSGSGPAYVFMVIEALTDGGVKQGLARSTALRLATQTVYGAAKLVLETGKHPAVLRDEVTTPGGTTIAAVAELENQGLRTMFIDAVKTATARSKQLSHSE